MTAPDTDGFKLRRVEPDPRDARIATLEAEVARLEALILQINDDLGRTWDTGLVDAEALRIRSRVP